MGTRRIGMTLHDETLHALRTLRERLGWGSSDAVLEESSRVCHLIDLPKKRSLFTIGEDSNYFYRVIKGCVQLHITHAGSDEKKIISFVREPGTVCYEAALVGEPFPLSAEAVCDSRILACPRSFMHELIARDPVVGVGILQSLSKQYLAHTKRMSDLLLKSGLQRVACYLLEHSPAVASNSFEVTLPASKQSVASHLHLSHEAFSRILANLRHKGLIQVKGRVVSVLDMEKLEQVKLGCSLKQFLDQVQVPCEEICQSLIAVTEAQQLQ